MKFNTVLFAIVAVMAANVFAEEELVIKIEYNYLTPELAMLMYLQRCTSPYGNAPKGGRVTCPAGTSCQRKGCPNENEAPVYICRKGRPPLCGGLAKQ
jgi:hypothetical protein